MTNEIRGRVKWVEKMQFVGNMDTDQCAIILGDGGISPMKLLLLSVAGCTPTTWL